MELRSLRGVADGVKALAWQVFEQRVIDIKLLFFLLIFLGFGEVGVLRETECDFVVHRAKRWQLLLKL